MLLKKADTVLDDAILESAKRSARIDIASGPLPLNQSCFFRRPKTFFNSIDPSRSFQLSLARYGRWYLDLPRPSGQAGMRDSNPRGQELALRLRTRHARDEGRRGKHEQRAAVIPAQHAGIAG